MMRRFACTLLALAAFAQAAEAMVLGCMPLRPKGERQIEAYVDGFAPGAYPPKTIDTVRVLARLGEDLYEFDPVHAKEVSLRDGMLRIHLLQALSAGATAEMRIEGKIAANKGEQFKLQFWIRNERRSGEGGVLCTIE
jgi:hypothetical protein